MVNVVGNSDAPDLLHVDWFAGIAGIHRACVAGKIPSVALDVKYDGRWQNFTGNEGVVTSFSIMRRLRKRGGNHWGTVCSSWVKLNKATSRRYPECPLGVAPRPDYVIDANKMVSLMAVFWLWSIARGCITILEQPSTSLMRYHPRMKQVKRVLGDRWRLVHTHMGAFGGPTEKATLLHGDAPYLSKLQRTPTPADYSRFGSEDHQMVTKSESGAFSGGADLKQSQAYPPEYAQCVVDNFLKHLTEVQDIDSDSDIDVNDGIEHDQWQDAGLSDVCQWLGIPHDRLCF